MRLLSKFPGKRHNVAPAAQVRGSCWPCPRSLWLCRASSMLWGHAEPHEPVPRNPRVPQGRSADVQGQCSGLCVNYDGKKDPKCSPTRNTRSPSDVTGRLFSAGERAAQRPHTAPRNQKQSLKGYSLLSLPTGATSNCKLSLKSPFNPTRGQCKPEGQQFSAQPPPKQPPCASSPTSALAHSDRAAGDSQVWQARSEAAAEPGGHEEPHCAPKPRHVHGTGHLLAQASDVT